MENTGNWSKTNFVWGLNIMVFILNEFKLCPRMEPKLLGLQ